VYSWPEENALAQGRLAAINVSANANVSHALCLLQEGGGGAEMTGGPKGPQTHISTQHRGE